MEQDEGEVKKLLKDTELQKEMIRIDTEKHYLYQKKDNPTFFFIKKKQEKKDMFTISFYKNKRQLDYEKNGTSVFFLLAATSSDT